MSQPPAPTTPFKPRLYILPWGLYPRRITIYLKERNLLDSITLIPVHATPTGLSSAPGKPPGTVPILEASPGVYIRQSSAILEYLEDVFPSQAPNLRGSTPLETAHGRELMDVADELTCAFALYAHQASELFAPLEEQSEQAAGVMLKRLRQLVTQLEGMADPEGPFLVQGRGGQVSVVDCVMLSAWQFAHHVYGFELFEGGHVRLGKWLEAMKGRECAEMDFAPDFITEKARKLSVR